MRKNEQERKDSIRDGYAQIVSHIGKHPTNGLKSFMGKNDITMNIKRAAVIAGLIWNAGPNVSPYWKVDHTIITNDDIDLIFKEISNIQKDSSKRQTEKRNQETEKRNKDKAEFQEILDALNEQKGAHQAAYLIWYQIEKDPTTKLTKFCEKHNILKVKKAIQEILWHGSPSLLNLSHNSRLPKWSFSTIAYEQCIKEVCRKIPGEVGPSANLKPKNSSVVKEPAPRETKEIDVRGTRETEVIGKAKAIGAKEVEIIDGRMIIRF